MLKEFDDRLREKHGHRLIGVDETGRGSWVGSLVAAAVCLPPDFYLEGLNDSKKLSENKRIEYSEVIKKEALCYSIVEISSVDVDKHGITWSNAQAMEKAGKNVREQIGGVDLFVIDQSPCKELNPHFMLPKADGTSLSVAAASVLAKVYRDDLMYTLSNQYPDYCFAQNKGYIDANHIDVVNRLGIIKGLHRESFNVKGYNKPTQLKLI